MKLLNRASSIKCLVFLLTLLSMMLIAGMLLPIMTIKKFVFLGHSFSIFSGIHDLFIESHYLLAIAIFSFSVLFPAVKIIFLYRVLFSNLAGKKVSTRFLHLIHDLGRWSMLDVMIAAILFVSVKMNLVASVEIHYGLYLFAFAIILLMIVTSLTVKLVSDAE